MKEILLLYLFIVMTAAMKQAVERSSRDETVLSDKFLDAILEECTGIQTDAEFWNCSDNLTQV